MSKKKLNVVVRSKVSLASRVAKPNDIVPFLLWEVTEIVIE